MRGHPEAIDAVQRADEISLNPVVLGELLAGFRRGKKTKENRSRLESLLDSSRVMVVAIDEETSEFYADVSNALRSAGKPIPTNDIWIAASAMQHGLRLVTADRHFEKVPLVGLELLRS